MPVSLKTKLSVFLAVVLFFEASVVHASFLDIIRALVTINPLEVSVESSFEAEVDKVFKVEARVINKGEEKIEDAKAEIFLPVGLVLTQKESTQNLGVIQGKREKKGSWSVRGENTGDYIISIVASGELRGEIVSADGTVKVTLKEKSSPARGPFNVLQVFFDMFLGRFHF